MLDRKRGNNMRNFSKILITLGIVVLFVVDGCEEKTKVMPLTDIQTPELSSDIQIFNIQIPADSWDEGFNASWVGTYKSRVSADYAVTFELSADGTYKLSYGEGLVTTYSGKYNKDFSGGVSKSPLRYTITGLRVTNFDEKTITISSSWQLPSGNNTETYLLYRQ
jgi:hypothetical protein